MTRTPEDEAREQIDGMLDAAGWAVQDAARANIHAARGVALRNFALKSGHGFADYLLYVDGGAAGVIEAKKQGATLTGVEIQSAKYSEGLPLHLPTVSIPSLGAVRSPGSIGRRLSRIGLTTWHKWLRSAASGANLRITRGIPPSGARSATCRRSTPAASGRPRSRPFRTWKGR